MPTDQNYVFGSSDACGFPNWYVLRSLPSHERCVELLLSAKGIQYYCPRYQRPTRRTDRPHLNVHLPLFPGYVFARFTWDERKYATDIMGLQRTPILQFGTEPAILTENEVEQIRIMQANNAVPWERLIVPGDAVEVFGGSFAGVSGVVQSIGTRDFLVVNIVFMNRPIAALIDRDHVRLAAA